MQALSTLTRLNGPDFDEQSIIDQALQILERRARKPDHFISCPNDATAYVRLKLSEDPDREHFLCVYLDQRHGVIAAEILFSGTIDGAISPSTHRPAAGAGAERRGGRAGPQPSER